MRRFAGWDVYRLRIDSAWTGGAAAVQGKLSSGRHPMSGSLSFFFYRLFGAYVSGTPQFLALRVST